MRARAALSIRHVTGQPSSSSAWAKAGRLRAVHPIELLAGFLHGDMLSLIEKAESTLEPEKSEELLEALLGDGFRRDFRDQLRQIKKLGRWRAS